MKIAALVMKAAFILPCNNLIHDGFLFAGGSPKIDAGGLNAFVSHQVGKKSDIMRRSVLMLSISMMRFHLNYLITGLGAEATPALKEWKAQGRKEIISTISTSMPLTISFIKLRRSNTFLSLMHRAEQVGQ